MNQNTELVMQAQSGDPHAFARLYAELYQDLYRFALYTLRHTQDAEDAVSETVADAFAQIKTLREANAFRSWMFQILSAKCKQRLRQYANRTEELPEELPLPEADLAGQLDVRRAFYALSDEDRMILSLHLFAGYSSSEIGALLQMKDGTVRSRQSRALKKMAETLTERRPS